jgi:hypothetical protein
MSTESVQETSQESTRKVVIIKPLPATNAETEPVTVTPVVSEVNSEDQRKKDHLRKLSLRRRSDS